MIDIINVSKDFGQGPVLDHINLKLNKNEVT